MDGFDGHEVRVAQFTMYGNHPVEHAGDAPARAERVLVGRHVQIDAVGRRVDLLALLVDQRDAGRERGEERLDACRGLAGRRVGR